MFSERKSRYENENNYQRLEGENIDSQVSSTGIENKRNIFAQKAQDMIRIGVGSRFRPLKAECDDEDDIEVEDLDDKFNHHDVDSSMLMSDLSGKTNKFPFFNKQRTP